MRRRGVETSPKLNQADYYFFWVMGTSPPPGTGSVTVGHFAVNKHTADIWDTVTQEVITSVELQGTQQILRKAHRIDVAATVKYREKPLWRPDAG